jgi:hypothetical protein
MTNMQDKIIKLDQTKNKKETYDLGGLLSQVFSQFANELKPKLIACFELLDDTLFDMAEKAETNQNQTIYFETMRSIRKQRTQVFNDFFNSFKLCFKHFKNNKFDYFSQGISNSSEGKSLSLSLIDEKELDETLAISNLINKSDMVYHRHLYAFEKRFSVLASGIEINANQVPISPHVIVNSFAQCLKKLDITVTIKLIIYKMFERSIMGQLNDIYTHVNEFLATKGIIPEISYNIGQHGKVNSHSSEANNFEVKDHKLDNQSTSASENTQYSTGQNPTSIDPNYQLISQLFSQSHQSVSTNSEKNDQDNSAYVGTSSTVTSINVNSMMNALTSLQNNMFSNVPSNNQYQSPTEIKQKLLNQLHELDANTIDQKVNKKDEETIDLVGMLFQFIVDDRNLPNAIQVIIARLQIPYLKVALKDRNLFADRNHPARKLLDKLSIESVGWTEKFDRNKLFISQIEKITKEILNLEDYSEKFYIDRLTQFEEFLTKQKKKSDVALKRSKEKTLGRDKINKAKEDSAQLLIDKMNHKQMPLLIRDLLLGEWANVLILMFLRHGSDSQEYKEKAAFVDLIINHSQAKPIEKTTANEIKTIIKKYEEGLKIVAFNPKGLIDKKLALLECLNQIHQININESNTEDIKIISAEEILKQSDTHKKHEILEYVDDIINPSDQSNQEEIEEKYLKFVASLKIGTWFEFINENNTEVRAKLSWISPITGKYLFVNSRGLKISDKSNMNLAVGLKNKTIKILKQVALFDRALSSIAKQLKNPETESKIIKNKVLKTDKK